MKILTVIVFSLLGFSESSHLSQTTVELMKTKNELRIVIETFVKAGTDRNTAAYNTVLHPEFRVIANRYPVKDQISIIPKSKYVALITQKVIGGTPYSIVFKDFIITDHSATVTTFLKADKGGQLVTFLLVKNPEGQWQIITNMATQQKH